LFNFSLNDLYSYQFRKPLMKRKVLACTCNCLNIFFANVIVVNNLMFSNICSIMWASTAFFLTQLVPDHETVFFPLLPSDSSVSSTPLYRFVVESSNSLVRIRYLKSMSWTSKHKFTIVGIIYGLILSMIFQRFQSICLEMCP
jgi:hypothetical protein